MELSCGNTFFLKKLHTFLGMYNTVATTDHISIRSFRKKNINAFTKQLLSDIGSLLCFMHKILYLRFLYNKAHIYINSTMTKKSTSLSIHIFKYYSFLLLISATTYTNDDYLSSANAYNSYYIYPRHYIYVNATKLYLSYLSYLYYYLSHISFIALCFKNNIGISAPPTSVHRFTVLRSPHIDKKSREQFESRVYKRIFSFNNVYSSFFHYMCHISYTYFLCTFSHTFHTANEVFI
jgi:hypothetical protein